MKPKVLTFFVSILISGCLGWNPSGDEDILKAPAVIFTAAPTVKTQNTGKTATVESGTQITKTFNATLQATISSGIPITSTDGEATQVEPTEAPMDYIALLGVPIIEDRGDTLLVKDINGLEVVVDKPQSEENNRAIESGEAKWSWELRGFTKTTSEGREQVLRENEWLDKMDTLSVPGWGTFSIEGDLVKLAQHDENEPNLVGTHFNHSEAAIQQWIEGMSYLFGEKAVIPLLQVDDFKKANQLQAFLLPDYPEEITDFSQGLTIILTSEYDTDLAVDGRDAGRRPDLGSGYRAEAGRPVLTFYLGHTDFSFASLDAYLSAAGVVQMLYWLHDQPDKVDITFFAKGEGIMTYWDGSVGRLRPGIPEVMEAFFGYKPITEATKELWNQLKTGIPLTETH